jgi:hypothetical protein
MGRRIEFRWTRIGFSGCLNLGIIASLVYRVCYNYKSLLGFKKFIGGHCGKL